MMVINHSEYKKGILMIPINTSKRLSRGVPAFKLLITVASMAATLGGWVAFSLPGSTTKISSFQSQAANLDLAPIPTILPRLFEQRNTFQSNNQPANSQTSLTALRSVDVQPPAPVTITRSSQ
jgi:hypothetical protein